VGWDVAVQTNADDSFTHLAEAGGVDRLSVGVVAVVKVVDVERAAWNTHTLSYLVVLFQPIDNIRIISILIIIA